MKKNHFSIFSLWKKYKIFLYLNMTIILVLSLTTDLAAAGSTGGNSISDNPQQITVKGKVTDASTGEALPGVNIVVKGTTLGVLTDVTGNYTLEVPNASATLVFSFIGYVSQEIALGGQTTLNVALIIEPTQLNEVVVVGYGTQLKKDLTGAVSTVSADRLLDKTSFQRCSGNWVVKLPVLKSLNVTVLPVVMQ